MFSGTQGVLTAAHIPFKVMKTMIFKIFMVCSTSYCKSAMGHMTWVKAVNGQQICTYQCNACICRYDRSLWSDDGSGSQCAEQRIQAEANGPSTAHLQQLKQRMAAMLDMEATAAA